jgi:hypothetical protein
MNDIVNSARRSGQAQALADYGIKTAEGLGDYYDQAVDWTSDRIGDADNAISNFSGTPSLAQSVMGGMAGGNSLRHVYEQEQARRVIDSAAARKARIAEALASGAARYLPADYDASGRWLGAAGGVSR